MDFRLKKLDWYIIKKFISTFFMALLLIIVIVIIFDISEKIDDFVEKEAPLHAIIFDYYLNYIPYFINMFSPLFVFITVIFFTSRMAQNSEIVAVLSCGISYHRLLVPYLISALLIASLSLGLNLYVIPHSNATRVDFESMYRKKTMTTSVRNLHYQIAPGRFVFVESFSSWNNTAYRFTLEEIKDGVLVSKTSAETAVWDTLSGKWKLNRYMTRNYSEGLLDFVEEGESKDTTIALMVKDFYHNEKTVETLDNRELNDLIETQKLRGDANVIYSQIEKQTRYALPFSAFVLTIMGLSLSSRKKRGGIGFNLAIGIALSFSYILFLRFSQMFVITGTLPPAVALWLPNIIFAIITAYLYKIAPK